MAGRLRLGPFTLLVASASAFSIWSPRAPHANVTTVGDDALAGVFRWTARRQGTLRYAISPDFCDAMQPAVAEASTNYFWSSWMPFHQMNFSSCERVQHVVHTAFRTWQAANPALHFVDVTGRCAAERMWTPIDEQHCVISPWCMKVENQTEGRNYVGWTYDSTPLELANPGEDTCSHRTCWDCQRADVVIGAFSQKNRQLGDQHGRARVIRNGMVNMRPIGTDGRPQPGGQLGRAVLQFNADHAYMDNGTALGKCWKIESDVCDWVADWTTSGVDVPSTSLTLFLVLLIVSLCCCCGAFCLCLKQLSYFMLQGYDINQDGKLSFDEFVSVVDSFIGDVCFQCQCPQLGGKQVSSLSGSITLLETFATMPVIIYSLSAYAAVLVFILYAAEITRCFDCWDLAAAAHHQVGHLLSLDHSEEASAMSIAIVRLNTSGQDFMPPPAPPPPPEVGEANLPPVAPQREPPLPPSTPPPSPPPAYPPPLPPIAPNTLGSTIGATLASPYCDPSVTEMADAWTLRHANHRFGKQPPRHLFDHTQQAAFNESIMREFEPFATSSPLGPGRVRRCLSQDDLDGLNFLYPPCNGRYFMGLPRPPPCAPESDWIFTSQRVLVTTVYMCFYLVITLFTIKLLSHAVLLVQQIIAERHLRLEALEMMRGGSGAVDHATKESFFAMFTAHRRRRKRRKEMIIRIQKMWRVKKARRAVQALRDDIESHEVHQAVAASKLQAVVRGREARSEVGVPGTKKAKLYKMRQQIVQAQEYKKQQRNFGVQNVGAWDAPILSRTRLAAVAAFSHPQILAGSPRRNVASATPALPLADLETGAGEAAIWPAVVSDL